MTQMAMNRHISFDICRNQNFCVIFVFNMWNKCCCEYVEEDCYPDWRNTQKVKGRFGLAFVAETPCCCPEPIGWQVEFCDTPSNVEQTCKEMITWVNCPPLPLCAPCPPTEVVSPCFPPKYNPCCPRTNPCSSQYSENCCSESCNCYIDNSRRKCYNSERHCGCNPPFRRSKHCRWSGDINISSCDEDDFDISDSVRMQSTSRKNKRSRSYRSNDIRHNNLCDEIPVKENRKKPSSRETQDVKDGSSTYKWNYTAAFSSSCSDGTFSNISRDHPTYVNNKWAYKTTNNFENSSHSSKMSGRDADMADKNIEVKPPPYQTVDLSDPYFERNLSEDKFEDNVCYEEINYYSKDEGIECSNRCAASVDSLDLPMKYYTDDPLGNNKPDTGNQSLENENIRDPFGNYRSKLRPVYPPSTVISENVYACTPYSNSEFVSFNQPPPYVLDVHHNSLPINAQTMTSNVYIPNVPSYKFCAMPATTYEKIEQVDNRNNTANHSTNRENYYMLRNKRLYVAHIPPFTVPSKPPICEVQENGAKTNTFPLEHEQVLESQSKLSKNINFENVQSGDEDCSESTVSSKIDQYNICTSGTCDYDEEASEVESRNCCTCRGDQNENIRHSENNQVNPTTLIHKQEKVSDNSAKNKTATNNEVRKADKSVGIAHSADEAPALHKKTKHTLSITKGKKSANVEMEKMTKATTVSNVLAQGDTKKNLPSFIPAESAHFKHVENLSGSDIFTYFRGKSNFDSMSSTEGVITEFISNLTKPERLNIPATVKENILQGDSKNCEKESCSTIDTQKEGVKESTKIKIIHQYQENDESMRRIIMEESKQKHKPNIFTSTSSSTSPSRIRKVEERVEIKETADDDDDDDDVYVEKKKRWPFDFLKNISRKLGDIFKACESDTETLTEPLIYIDGVPYTYPSKQIS